MATSYAIQSYKQPFKIHFPSPLVIVRENNEKYLSMSFESSKVHDIQKWQSTR